jgi:hypothetical protein
MAIPGFSNNRASSKSKFIGYSAKRCGQPLTVIKGASHPLGVALFSTEKKWPFCVQRFSRGSIFSEERFLGDPKVIAQCSEPDAGVALGENFYFQA